MRFFGCQHKLAQVAGRIGDPRQQRRAVHSSGDARQVQLTNGFEAKIRPRRARFEDAGELGVHGSDGEADVQTVVLHYLTQQFRVTKNQIRLGDDP